MKSALLFRLGGLGDLLIALPSIQLLRRAHPVANLTLVCRRTYGELLQEAAIIDNIFEEDSKRLLPLFSPVFDPGAEQVRWLREFDSVIGWFSKKMHLILEKNLDSVCPGASLFVNYDARSRQTISRFFFQKTMKAWTKGRGEEDVFFKECALLRFPSIGRAGALRKDRADGRVAKMVVVHPGSGSEEKRWPLYNFLQIIERLGQKKVGGLIVTGEAEERMLSILREACLPGGWSWIHFPSLTMLSSLLFEADLYFGNDSGITHLAAACGSEVLALFRSDLVTAWKPYGRVHVLSAESVSKIDPEFVWAKISDLLFLS